MYTIKPIAFVDNQRTEIQDDNWGEIISIIRLNEDLSEESIKGIEEFSHLEILFYFHKVSDDKIQYEARHPRNNKEWPEVGILLNAGKIGRTDWAPRLLNSLNGNRTN